MPVVPPHYGIHFAQVAALDIDAKPRYCDPHPPLSEPFVLRCTSLGGVRGILGQKSAVAIDVAPVFVPIYEFDDSGRTSIGPSDGRAIHKFFPFRSYVRILPGEASVGQ